jgi:hypothetical protein
LNELLGAASWPPIVEPEDNTLRDIKLDPATTFNPVPPRRYETRLIDLVRPWLSVKEQRATSASIVISNDQIRATIF